MKKITFAALCFFSMIGYSQSCINGLSTVNVGTTVTYTTSAVAQCAECYDWDINGNPLSSDNTTVGNVRITGSDTANTVSIQVLAAGPFTVNLTYFNENGCNECTFSGTGVNPGTMLPKFTCFGYDPVVGVGPDPFSGTFNQFFINGSGLNAPGLTYQWFWRYSNGSLSSEYGFAPQFWEKCDGNAQGPANRIVAFGVIISNGTTSAKYYSCPNCTNAISIPGFGPAQARTCFLHEVCAPPITMRNATQAIKLVSNPVRSTVKFEGDNLQDYQITFFDTNGKQMEGSKELSSSVAIDKFPKGIYIYKILDAAGTLILDGKIVKE
ncbi:T9SS type A sorting domain-containing protein [Flavobacterium pallidum]|uniref:Secretion system C-terminal sorting domain-containing protein n=1 Tax=Flavobacterium pallidum TaxID=2172098 RepID=A0A2S1SK37_9FLAO|nr:T9SS type A sorting domain-containing protein [Flavobacterium pallidum]AWI26784.1 hypothetical protein HYN49_13250 [Flavobacterium pallidum]